MHHIIMTTTLFGIIAHLMNIISSPFINSAFNDSPEPWKIGFQDGASPTFEGITELHDSIFFYLIVIGVGVTWFLGSLAINYNTNASPLSHKYYNHGTLIELV